jgi:HAD superfamily hydrolase (TIGR01509 family)
MAAMIPESDARCLVCGGALRGDSVSRAPIVWCAACRTPHHEECFSYNGRCAIFGCTGLRYRREGPGGPPVTWIEIRGPEGAMIPQSYIVDFESVREAILAEALHVAIVAAATLGPLWLLWQAPAHVFLAGVALCCATVLPRAHALARTVADRVFQDHWIIDGKTRRLRLHRRVLGRPELCDVTPFAELTGLALVRRRAFARSVPGIGVVRFSEWSLRLERSHQKPVDLSLPIEVQEHDDPPAVLQETGQRVAAITGLTLTVEPQPTTATGSSPLLGPSTGSTPRIGMKRQARAVIFDLDGVLVDSEPVHFEVLRELLGSDGLDLTPEMNREFIGRSDVFAFETLVRRHRLPRPVPEYLEAYERAIVAALSAPRPAADGATRLISELRQRGCRLAVASSSRTSWVRTTLDSIGLAGAFDAVVCGDAVEHTKPAPDIYLLAARLVKVGPYRCVAVEDSPAGVAAARSAGMITLGLVTPYIDRFRLTHASGLIVSLTEFPLELVEDQR